MLTITEKHMEAFNTQLLDYHDTGDAAPLKQFMYDNAIQGLEL